MSFRISIIGCGYVGCVTGVCLADLGKEVVLVDVDPYKIGAIINLQSPIYEPGLEELISKNNSRIFATMDLNSAIEETDLTFIAVGTPSSKDGSINLKYVIEACETIGKTLKKKDDFHTVIVKSTVFPGTTEGIVRKSLEKNSGKTAGEDFGLGVNPEFLREGSAVADFLSPDRVVIGANDPKTADILRDIYSFAESSLQFTSITAAEMIKYASNAFLATKISFANQIGNLCKILGIDSQEVFKGVGMDSRIGPAFFGAGIGFGGSCFPKDVRALVSGAKELGESLTILDAVIAANEAQPLRLLSLLHKHIPEINGKTVGVLGLAFKPNTDDIRESRAIPIVGALLSSGASVIAYDPAAMDNFRQIFPHITYAPSATAVLKADIVIIVTEWEEFESLDYHGKIVIDGRRIEAARQNAAIYEGVCW